MIAIILIFIALSTGVALELPIEQLSYNIEYSEIMIISTIVVLLVSYFQGNKKIQYDFYVTLALAIYVLLFAHSIFTYSWSPYGLTSIPGTLIFFYGFLSILIGSYYFKDNHDLYILASRVFVISLIAQLFLNFSVGLASGATGFYDLKDYASTLIGKSNFISIFITFDLLYEFISKDKHWQFFFIVDLVALIATISRGAIVSLVLALLIYFIVGLINVNFNKKALVGSFAFLFTLFIVFMIFTPPGRTLLEGLSAGLGASTVGSRQVLWQDAFTESIQNPLGIGVVWKDDPHNYIFSSLRNLGLFYGVVYIVFLTAPLLILIHPKVKLLSKKSIALLIGYLSVIIHALIEVFFFTKLSVIWTAFTLVYIYFVVKKDCEELNVNKENTINQKYFFNNKLFEKLKNE